MQPIDPLSMIRPRRPIAGISAILLPFLDDASIDWPSFEAHVLRTADAGLTPAVNMDTGYVNLLNDEQRRAVLDRTRSVLGGRSFVAGVFVGDRTGDRFDGDGYKREIEQIVQRGGTPVIFQSYGLCQQDGEGILNAYRELAAACDRFIGFELTTELAPFGAIYDLDVYAGLMEIKQCVGAKHSSFHRAPEWQRLRLRDEKRPEFIVYTGNDFAIDMVLYGSDYLLGLSTFAPDLFAKRDAFWAAGDPAFYELNDALQYLGMFAFRSPGPGYKHNAAQFLKLRGWTKTDRCHPKSVKRPASDVEVLREIGLRLGVL
jgi:dihydrodipicolinate synthase/N-acetylneuraminate lyase